MRKFLINAFIFMAFPVLYFGANMTINRYIYTHQAVSIEEKNILIAGDSHVQKSLNPKYFVSAQNIAQTAEPYIITFWKLNEIFKTHTPDTLILGFAPHNISQFNDVKFSDDLWSGEMFKRSYPIEKFSEVSDSISVNYQAFYKVLWKQTAFYPKVNHINYIGNYANTDISDISDWETALEGHFYPDGRQLSTSGVAINYLDSIINLCNSKNIDVVLVSSPVHRKYREGIPPVIMKDYADLARKYSAKHIVFDKTNARYADSLYLNSDHLNEYGAEKFTLDLIQHLHPSKRSFQNFQ